MDAAKVHGYVMERILELLNKATLDSYRVRINNVYTSIIEARDIIKRSGEMKVKTFETVRLLVSETIDLLKEDQLLQFQTYSKNLLIGELEDFIRQSADKFPNKLPYVDRILFCLNKCVEENKNQYLSALFAVLDSLLSECEQVTDEGMMEYVGRIDSTVSALCVQLIADGYNKRFLYTELKHYSGLSFEAFLKALKEFGKKKNHQFEIIWRVNIPESKPEDVVALGFIPKPNIEHINDLARERYKKMIAPAKNYFFFQDSVFALDMYSAAMISREKLMQRFDGIHLGCYSKRIPMPSSVLTLEKRAAKWFALPCVVDYFLDGAFAEDYALSSKLNAMLEKIYLSKSIDKAAQDRIKSAIRHLNYGDLDSEIEQRFINYWIALEFVFASPHTNENTFTRLKSYLVDILAVSYVGRNVGYLNDKLVEAGIIGSEDDIWQSAAVLDSVAERPDLPLIWKYKLKKMKSRLFTHTDKMKKYYSNHITNLERHIARIYNLRNVLVHEGAIKQDVEDLASNLRYYLVFLIDQMLSFFTEKAEKKGLVVQIDDFFNEYRSYRKYIDANFALNTLLSIPINKNLW